ncbi:MAG TPA: hypothetical protein ENN46_02735 [Candidatus Woesearchaeota archaeon]|nr:hypothetical protein [Candidatus Woesearchaeota archaeon]
MASKKRQASQKRSPKKAAPKKKATAKASSKAKKSVNKTGPKQKKTTPGVARAATTQVKPAEKRKELNLINLIQMFLEIIIASGFFIALIGQSYKYIAWSWVLPLSIVCLILAWIEKNNSFWLTAVCIPVVIIAWFGTAIGTLSTIAGLLISVMAAVSLISNLYD